MFGDRGPLRDKAGDAGGGGGYVPLLQRVAPNSMKSMVGSYDQATLPGYQTEAPAPEGTQPEPAAGSTTSAAGGSRKRLGSGLEIPGPKKGPGTGWTGHIEISPGPAPDVAAGIRAREDRINQQETLQHLVDMRTSGFTREQMLRWAQLNDADAEVAGEFARTTMPEIRRKITDLQKQADEARALKVDPYHWHKSIGRGGRVAAAFAALTGGFAAGKSNPNSALNMLDAAIERDISAQEANIRNNIQALQLQRGLVGDERQAVQDELQTMSQIRAMKYAGIVGRIQAAQQHAVTEAHHMSLQTARDHYELKYLQAIAAAQQEIIKLEYDGPIKNAEQIAKLKRQTAEYQQMIRTQPSGGVTIPTERVQTLEGDVTGPRPEASIVVQPAPGRSGAVAGRSRGAGRGVAPGGSGRGTGGQEAPRTSAEGAIPEGAVAQDDQGRYLDAEGKVVEAAAPAQAPAEPTRGGAKGARQTADRVARSIAIKPHIRAQQSFARTVAENENRSNARITTWGEAIEDIEAGRPIRDDGMTGTDDAEVIREYLKERKPDPSMYKGGTSSASYQAALQQWQYSQDFPESLERDSFLAGEYAKVRTGSGRAYTIMVGSRDKDNFKRIREELIKADDSLDALESMATLIRQNGLTGLITEDGKWGIPGLTNTNPAVLEKMNQAIGQAMNYIKRHDPTARISDKDLEVGMQAATPWETKMAAIVDFTQRMLGADPKKSKQAEKFLAKLAVETQRHLYRVLANDVVPDYNTLGDLSKRAKAVDQFVYTQRGESMLSEGSE